MATSTVEDNNNNNPMPDIPWLIERYGTNPSSFPSVKKLDIIICRRIFGVTGLV
ncbi:MAG: hypothetical protein WCC17_17335 [Candidatus Nitrosopolaris sp.]